MRAAAILTYTFLLVAATCLFILPADAQVREGEGFAFEVEAINEGLSAIEPPVRLDTPRSALESFVGAVSRGDYARAAHALNLNFVPTDEQADRGPVLAMKLAFLLQLHRLIEWSELPDRPDARVLPNGPQEVEPYMRRTIVLGEIGFQGRPMPLGLQRFKPRDGPAVWMFSPFAVEHIDELFAENGPGLLSEWVPLHERVGKIGQASWWEWLAIAVFLLAAAAVWFGVYRLVRFIGARLARRWARPACRMAPLLATAVAALAFNVATEHLLLLAGPVTGHADTASALVALTAGTWLVVRLVADITLAMSQRYIVPLALNTDDNRRLKTRVYVARRLALMVVGLLGLGYVLSEVGLFESFGVSLLASAGALGALVAIAAQPLLGNMVSGLQIALAEPVRIGDVVVYEGHWATVEDIAFAHTVLRTWTDTRLIVPHSDLLSKPLENWSKEGEAVRRIVKLPVDFRLDVDQVREFVEELVEGDERRTSEPPRVEVVEADADSAVLWIWLSGTSAMAAWTLHNDVREKVMELLKELDDGAYLPRRRQVLLGEGRLEEGAAGSRAAGGAESATAAE